MKFADMHTHSFISLCCHDEAANAQNYLNKAAEVGIAVLGITDHCWDERVPVKSNDFYSKQTIPWVKQIEKQLPVDTKGIKFYIGIESEYCGMSDKLGITAEGAAQFDYVLIPHTHTHMKNFVIPRDPIYQQTAEKIAERIAAKKAKDYALADAIRNELLAKGVTLIDTRDGTDFKIEK